MRGCQRTSTAYVRLLRCAPTAAAPLARRASRQALLAPNRPRAFLSLQAPRSASWSPAVAGMRIVRDSRGIVTPPHCRLATTRCLTGIDMSPSLPMAIRRPAIRSMAAAALPTTAWRYWLRYRRRCPEASRASSSCSSHADPLHIPRRNGLPPFGCVGRLFEIAIAKVRARASERGGCTTCALPPRRAFAPRT